jgi:hypothetical protein
LQASAGTTPSSFCTNAKDLKVPCIFNNKLNSLNSKGHTRIHPSRRLHRFISDFPLN